MGNSVTIDYTISKYSYTNIYVAFKTLINIIWCFWKYLTCCLKNVASSEEHKSKQTISDPKAMALLFPVLLMINVKSYKQQYYTAAQIHTSVSSLWLSICYSEKDNSMVSRVQTTVRSLWLKTISVWPEQWRCVHILTEHRFQSSIHHVLIPVLSLSHHFQISNCPLS